jgi:predicted nucleotidyltransferase
VIVPLYIIERMDPAAIEASLRGFFASDRRGLLAAYVFGSVARGTPRADSDVDVAVLFEEPPPATLEGLPCQLEDELADLMKAPVQVVVLNTASPDFVHRVLRDGRLLVDHDPSRRIRFEVRSRNEFFDLEPILRRYRTARR